MTIYYSANARNASGPVGPEAFRLLFVCIANECRSPMAERICRHELALRLGDGSPGWTSSSAGTEGTDGRSMHRYSTRALTGLGADPTGFTSRELTHEIITSADLILTASASERDVVIGKVPTVLPLTYTLREFARLVVAVPGAVAAAPGDPITRGRAIVSEARKARGRVPYVEPAMDDIVDPPRNPGSFERCAADIQASVRIILTVLTDTMVGAGR